MSGSVFSMINTQVNKYIYPPLLISTDFNPSGKLVESNTRSTFTFTESGTLTLRTHDGKVAPPANNLVSFVMVGGGGSGGSGSLIEKNGVFKTSFGSGGGGGTVLVGKLSMCVSSPVETLQVSIGAGGLNVLNSNSLTFPESKGSNGGDTSLILSSVSYEASGGFSGSSFFGGKSGNKGVVFGGVSNPDIFTGGAGGASSVNFGENAQNENGQDGSQGYFFPNNGLYYGGGGGGGNSEFSPSSIPGFGGTNSGGAGGNVFEFAPSFASSGLTNTGGGGGGGGLIGSGIGGSGVVIIFVNK